MDYPVGCKYYPSHNSLCTKGTEPSRMKVLAGRLWNSYEDTAEIVCIERLGGFCPNSLFDRSSKKNAKIMSFELFQKVIQDLINLSYKGRIGLHHYNEPLLDPRLPELIKYVKSKLPKSKVVVMSNGDVLSEEMFGKLVDSGMDKMIISLHAPITRNAFVNSTGSKRIQFKNMSTRKLSNRGGLVSPERITEIPRCLNPFSALVITHSGMSCYALMII